LTGYFLPNFVPPLAIIAALNEARVRFVLIGSHGLGGWLQEPRASQDVDFLVTTRDYLKSIRTLLAEYPRLEADRENGMTRLRDTASHDVAVNLLAPNQEWLRAALRHTHTVQFEGIIYRIPSLEMALVLKFAAMTRRPWTEAQKYQDMHDFMCIALANRAFNAKKLSTLGDLVYPGGGVEIVEKVRQVRAGEKLQL